MKKHTSGTSNHVVSYVGRDIFTAVEADDVGLSQMRLAYAAPKEPFYGFQDRSLLFHVSRSG
jgi:hypothetical protein